MAAVGAPPSYDSIKKEESTQQNQLNIIRDFRKDDTIDSPAFLKAIKDGADVQRIQTMIREGHNPRFKVNGCTPFYAACQYSGLDMVRFLHENSYDQEREYAVDYAIENKTKTENGDRNAVYIIEYLLDNGFHYSFSNKRRFSGVQDKHSLIRSDRVYQEDVTFFREDDSILVRTLIDNGTKIPEEMIPNHSYNRNYYPKKDGRIEALILDTFRLIEILRLPEIDWNKVRKYVNEFKACVNYKKENAEYSIFEATIVAKDVPIDIIELMVQHRAKITKCVLIIAAKSSKPDVLKYLISLNPKEGEELLEWGFHNYLKDNIMVIINSFNVTEEFLGTRFKDACWDRLDNDLQIQVIRKCPFDPNVPRNRELFNAYIWDRFAGGRNYEVTKAYLDAIPKDRLTILDLFLNIKTVDCVAINIFKKVLIDFPHNPDLKQYLRKEANSLIYAFIEIIGAYDNLMVDYLEICGIKNTGVWDYDSMTLKKLIEYGVEYRLFHNGRLLKEGFQPDERKFIKKNKSKFLKASKENKKKVQNSCSIDSLKQMDDKKEKSSSFSKLWQ